MTGTADRAKAIKTTATVNESPTDKLIRELREENARLMELLKSGGITLEQLQASGGAIGQNPNQGKEQYCIIVLTLVQKKKWVLQFSFEFN